MLTKLSQIVTAGGNRQTVCCKGFGEPHDVSLDKKSLSFGNMELGKASLRTVEVAPCPLHPQYRI